MEGFQCEAMKITYKQTPKKYILKTKRTKTTQRIHTQKNPQNKRIHQQHLLANKNHTKIKICSSSLFFKHSFGVTEKPFFLVPQGSG